MSVITSVEQLEALYGFPGEASLVKELDHVIPEYAAFIEASPFVALATSGPEGLDCSPRGDLAGFVHIVDDKTLMMPDRRGNNRADSLKNIIRDPRVGLLFLVPGSGTTLRINGRAQIPRMPNSALPSSSTASRRAPSPSSQSTRSISNAPAPSCARNCGTPKGMSIRSRCRRRGRSWRSPAARTSTA